MKWWEKLRQWCSGSWGHFIASFPHPLFWSPVIMHICEVSRPEWRKIFEFFPWVKGGPLTRSFRLITELSNPKYMFCLALSVPIISVPSIVACQLSHLVCLETTVLTYACFVSLYVFAMLRSSCGKAAEINNCRIVQPSFPGWLTWIFQCDLLLTIGMQDIIGWKKNYHWL